jgi:glutaminyl-tRNA synthetase
MKNSYSNFIEKIIKRDLFLGFSKKKLKFRFPPEPNGYIHIGHVKAIFLNFNIAKKYNAPINLRFDDTNPEKEEEIFVEEIKNDIKWLGFKWDKECYASDNFKQLYKWAKKLIINNKAYVDSQKQVIINLQRKNPFKPGIKSPYRSRSIEENIFLFEKMKNGFFKEGTCVLRAKINMNSSNINLRDPIMYRIINKSHPRTGTKWCIYPTYDWAHGQCDYIEQISHSICSNEFENHRPLYNWYIDQIYENNKIRPKQCEFSRLNLSYTITSKRKLKLLIKNKIVNNWDDPRMPTIRGFYNRGYTPLSIIKFIKSIGISKRENIINFSLLEFHLRNHLNKISTRVMVVINPIKLIIDNYPYNKKKWFIINTGCLKYNFHKIPFSKYLYIEKEDFKKKKKKFFFRLSFNQNVRLKYSFFIKVNYLIKNIYGKILEIHCIYYKYKNMSEKIKSTIHWVACNHAIKIKINIYEKLFIKKNSNNKDIFSIINKNSFKKITGYGEPFLKNVKTRSHFQFQRLGYFYSFFSKKNKNIFNKILSLKKNIL